MATMKSIRMSIGRSIRRATGLPLPIAMTLAKKLDKREASTDVLEKIRPYLKVRITPAVVIGGRVEYDASWEVDVVGPKGTYNYGYSDIIRKL